MQLRRPGLKSRRTQSCWRGSKGCHPKLHLQGDAGVGNVPAKASASSQHAKGPVKLTIGPFCKAARLVESASLQGKRRSSSVCLVKGGATSDPAGLSRHPYIIGQPPVADARIGDDHCSCTTQQQGSWRCTHARLRSGGLKAALCKLCKLMLCHVQRHA